ncbi:MFS transporter [Sphingomonas sp. NFR15]|uniref:MFS transporter n=1 Tax=Sphingomonas sp. NFR15 TaxID=1566282 RepID=UPI000889288F|nr:MFS transporter [Sphingomonas sp. NFR15]SDA21014.1 MFS/sugar transport protein [Sphingomonas sp. NFR15]
MLRRREVWSYAAGDFGFNTVWQSIELYLLFYYVRQLGIAPEVASLIFLAGAAADWLMDVFVGVTADRLAPRVRLGAWVAIGGPLSVLILCAALVPPPVNGGYVPYYALATYLALRCAYGIGNIPYGALTARISADPQDHLRLTGARMQAAALGGLVAALVYAVLPAGDAGGGFSLGAPVLAGIAAPTFFLTAFGTRERIKPAAAALRSDRALLAMFGLLARSSALRRLIATILAVGLAVSLLNVSLLFVFDRLGARRWGYYAALLPALSLLVTTPLWTHLATRIGQGATLRYAAMLMLGAALFGCFGGGVVMALVSVTGAIVAGQGLSVMFWSLVPATVSACEQDAAVVGYAGRVYAAATIARKLAQALSTQALALALVFPALPSLGGIAIAALLAVLCAFFYRPIEEMRRSLAP